MFTEEVRIFALGLAAPLLVMTAIIFYFKGRFDERVRQEKAKAKKPIGGVGYDRGTKFDKRA